LNKKREALRRGLRSFIEDTSKELADLEGRPLHPSPEEAEADGETGAVRGGIADAGAQGADPAPQETQPGPPAPLTPAPVPEPPQAPPPPPPVQSAPAAVRREDPPSFPPEAPASSTRELDRSHEAAVPESPPARANEVAAAPLHSAKPKRRAPAPVRRRPRPAADTGANGVNPAQVHARKGVCFAYFLNHECWRVADAYCNSALQVCITRECPIYHLHRDAFEHRFAKKFKHFW
jgi:hypothetical protein